MKKCPQASIQEPLQGELSLCFIQVFFWDLCHVQTVANNKFTNGVVSSHFQLITTPFSLGWLIKSQPSDSCVSQCFQNKKIILQEVSIESCTMRRIPQVWDTFLVLTLDLCLLNLSLLLLQPLFLYFSPLYVWLICRMIILLQSLLSLK